jgi:hypothetical protein
MTPLRMDSVDVRTTLDIFAISKKVTFSHLKIFIEKSVQRYNLEGSSTLLDGGKDV